MNTLFTGDYSDIKDSFPLMYLYEAMIYKNKGFSSPVISNVRLSIHMSDDCNHGIAVALPRHNLSLQTSMNRCILGYIYIMFFTGICLSFSLTVCDQRGAWI